MRDDNAVRAHWNSTPLDELRAKYPDLPYNRALVEKIIRERSIMPGRIKSLDELGENPTIDVLLDSYLHDADRHEFLAFYIEEIRIAARCSRQEPHPLCDNIAVDPDNGLHMCEHCGDAYMHGF